MAGLEVRIKQETKAPLLQTTSKHTHFCEYNEREMCFGSNIPQQNFVFHIIKPAGIVLRVLVR